MNKGQGSSSEVRQTANAYARGVAEAHAEA